MNIYIFFSLLQNSIRNMERKIKCVKNIDSLKFLNIMNYNNHHFNIITKLNHFNFDIINDTIFTWNNPRQ